MNHDLDAVARLAAPPVTEVGPRARELMHEITATGPAPEPVTRRRRLSLRVTVPAGALLTAAVLALTWLTPTTSYAALDIKQENGYYVIAIKDLYAAPQTYERQLRSLGLNISLQVKPVTAAFEGQVFPTSPDNRYLTEITGIYPPGPCDKLDGCAIGVKIPVGFKGVASVEVGRAAKPGETYQATTMFDSKGEPMYCVPYLNKTVAEVRPMLAARGITISKFVVADPGRADALDYEERDTVPETWLVHSGSLVKPGVATIFVHTKPISERYVKARTKDCPAS